MKILGLVPSAVMAMAVSGQSLADNSMNGTYMADKASMSLMAILPMRMYLVVNGDDAYFLMQGPDEEKKLPLKARADGNKLLLGDKDDKNPLIFYRRIGNSGILECLKCQAQGLPGVWIRVARER